jgi:hypothetical protein
LAVLLLPAILAEFTVNPDHFSFDQVLAQGFPLPPPYHNVKKVRFIFPLVAVFPAPVHRDGEFADRLTPCGILEFRVTGQPSYQDDMV